MKPADLLPTALPEELIRRWDQKYIDEKGKPQVKQVSLMYRRDVPQYRTDFLALAINLFVDWQLFNKTPPCGNGWAYERNVTVQILRIMESEENLYKAWQDDLKEAKRQKP